MTCCFSRVFDKKIGTNGYGGFADNITLSTWVDDSAGGVNQICISKRDELRMILKRSSYDNPDTPFRHQDVGDFDDDESYREVLTKSFTDKLIDNDLEIECKNIKVPRSQASTDAGFLSNLNLNDCLTRSEILDLFASHTNVTFDSGSTTLQTIVNNAVSSVNNIASQALQKAQQIANDSVAIVNNSIITGGKYVLFTGKNPVKTHGSPVPVSYIDDTGGLNSSYLFSDLFNDQVFGANDSSGIKDNRYLQGLVPESNGETDLFLRADGVWDIPLSFKFQVLDSRFTFPTTQTQEVIEYSTGNNLTIPNPADELFLSGRLRTHNIETDVLYPKKIRTFNQNTDDGNPELIEYDASRLNPLLNGAIEADIQDLLEHKHTFTEEIKFNYPTLGSSEQKVLIDIPSSNWKILTENNYLTGKDDLIIRKEGKTGIVFRDEKILADNLLIRSRDPLKYVFFYPAVSWEDIPYLIEQTRIIDTTSKKVAENSILQFSNNAIVKSSPAPICFVDEDGRISSGRLFDNDFKDQIFGIEDDLGPNRKPSKYLQGLVPSSVDVSDRENKYLRADGQWSELETPDISAGVRVENQSNYFFNIEVDGGNGSTQPTTGINFKTNDGHPTNPNKNQPTYIASQLQSGWESSEDAWKDAYLKIKTHASSSSLTTTMLLKQNKVFINPSNDSIAASEALEVNGNCKATKFIGDGSELTGIPKFDTINDSNKFVITSLADGGRFSYINATTNNIPEHTNNKYFTNERCDNRIDLKLSNGTVANIVANQLTGQTIIANSDIRLKENIKKIEKSNLEKLIPVEYNFKNDKNHKRYGFIAQDIKEDMNELIYEDSKGMLGVNYIDIIALLVKDNQELKKRIEKLENFLKINS